MEPDHGILLRFEADKILDIPAGFLSMSDRESILDPPYFFLHPVRHFFSELVDLGSFLHVLDLFGIEIHFTEIVKKRCNDHRFRFNGDKPLLYFFRKTLVNMETMKGKSAFTVKMVFRGCRRGKKVRLRYDPLHQFLHAGALCGKKEIRDLLLILISLLSADRKFFCHPFTPFEIDSMAPPRKEEE